MKLPTVIVSVASTANAGRHESATSGNPLNISTSSPTTPPIFDAVDRNAATGEGAPSYVSGAQKWNGTAEILNAKPTTTKNTLMTTIGSSPRPTRASLIPSSRTSPVTPYTSDIP